MIHGTSEVGVQAAKCCFLHVVGQAESFRAVQDLFLIQSSSLDMYKTEALPSGKSLSQKATWEILKLKFCQDHKIRWNSQQYNSCSCSLMFLCLMLGHTGKHIVVDSAYILPGL